VEHIKQKIEVARNVQKSSKRKAEEHAGNVKEAQKKLK
jgi:hypothetical protein